MSPSTLLGRSAGCYWRQRSPRKTGRRQPRLDLVQVGEVGRQILGGIVVMGNAAALRQLDELDPAQAEIVRGIGRGNAALVKKPENRGRRRTARRSLSTIADRASIVFWKRKAFGRKWKRSRSNACWHGNSRG